MPQCWWIASVTLLVGCSLSPQAKRDRFLQTGKKYLDQHEYSRAGLEFRNAAKAMPQDPEPYYQMALADLGIGELRGAIGLLRKTLDLNPKHVNAQLKLAQLMSETRDPETLENADERIHAVLAIAPDNADALSTLAVTQYRLGHPADAQTYLREAIAKAPSNIRSYALLAAIQMDKKDHVMAEKILKQATEAAPKMADSWIQLGRFYIYDRRLTDAEAQFRKAVDVEPRSGAARLDLGRILNASGRMAEAEQVFRSLSALPEPEFKLIHATFLLQQGRANDAISEMETIVKKYPMNRDARTRLVATYLDRRRVSDAVKTLDQVLKVNGRDLDALLQRSEIYLNQGKFDVAERDLTLVVRSRPDDAFAHYFLSRAYMARGADLLRRQELTEALRRNPSLLGVRIELADVMLEAGSAKTALDVVNAAPDEQRNSPAVGTMRNWALYFAGDLAAARTGINQGLARSKSPELTFQDALLKLRTGDTKGGRAALEQVLKVQPTDLRALQALANSYLAEKQNVAGIERIKATAAQQPRSARVQDYLGQMLLLVGDRAGARAAFHASKEVNPADEKADVGLAMLDTMEGRVDSARKTLRGLIAGNRPNSTAAIRLGMLEESAHDYPAAIAAYKTAVDARPNDWVPLNNLANCLIVIGKYDEALRYAQQAKELAPASVYVADTMGWALYNKGMYKSAVMQLEPLRNNAIAPGHYHLAMAYFKNGDLRRGKVALDAALRAEPGNPEAKMAQQVAADAMLAAERQ